MAELGWPLMINRIRDGSKNNAFAGVRIRNGKTNHHQGWDLQTPRGMHCYAVADGTILETQTVPDQGDYGEYVILELDAPLGEVRYAFYAHLSQVLVQAGNQVKLGDPLGMVGVTGNAVKVMRGDSLYSLALPKREDHLHFELRSTPKPGLGLKGRVDPQEIYGKCPLNSAVVSLRP